MPARTSVKVGWSNALSAAMARRVAGMAGYREGSTGMAKLSTHVLDTAAGVPAAGMAYVLERIAPGARVELKRGLTNADGRSDGPLLAAPALLAGSYELH